jgi:SAM-dependent methyltransferase
MQFRLPCFVEGIPRLRAGAVSVASFAKFQVTGTLLAAEMEPSGYIIRGGIEGRERLRVLSRVMQPTSLALLGRAGVRPGMCCLEVGCGGGDLAFDLARMVTPAGRVIGTDIDEEKLQIATREAAGQQLNNVEFLLSDIRDQAPGTDFDFVHARFVLTHLTNPVQALSTMRRALRAGGVIVVEDIDYRGHFCYPHCAALARFVELYTEAVRRRGGDANIGPRLPALLVEAGFVDVQVNVVQPAGTDGELKILAPITLESIAAVVLAEGLATPSEVEAVIAELYTFAQMPGSLVSLPRIVVAWGYRPTMPN